MRIRGCPFPLPSSRRHSASSQTTLRSVPRHLFVGEAMHVQLLRACTRHGQTVAHGIRSRPSCLTTLTCVCTRKTLADRWSGRWSRTTHGRHRSSGSWTILCVPPQQTSFGHVTCLEFSKMHFHVLCRLMWMASPGRLMQPASRSSRHERASLKWLAVETRVRAELTQRLPQLSVGVSGPSKGGYDTIVGT